MPGWDLPLDTQVPDKARNSTTTLLQSQWAPVRVPFKKEVTALSPNTTQGRLAGHCTPKFFLSSCSLEKKVMKKG